MIEFGQMRKFMEMDIIEVIPLAFMRGRTLNEAIVICDEAQNTSRSQMLMFLTRLGRGSKMIITGDITQTDLPSGERSGLVEAIAPLANIPGCLNSIKKSMPADSGYATISPASGLFGWRPSSIAPIQRRS
jgi:phosphate starvation-inducible PhoH-like protein